MGRYSYHQDQDQGQLLDEVLKSIPTGRFEPKTRINKQVHRRLRDDQIDDLVAGFKRGFTVNQLADVFDIERSSH